MGCSEVADSLIVRRSYHQQTATTTTTTAFELTSGITLVLELASSTNPRCSAAVGLLIALQVEQ